MLRKNIAPVIATILSGLLFIIIGSCFSAFLYKDEIIKIENPKIVTNQIQVFDKDGENAIDELKLSKLKLGLKPVTGELDQETNIPVTVTEEKGSEGLFAKVKVLAQSGAKIYVTDLKIDKKENNDNIQEEKKNIMVAIKEIKESATALETNKVLLGELKANNEKQDLTFYIWLSDKASEVLKSATISFNVSFEL